MKGMALNDTKQISPDSVFLIKYFGAFKDYTYHNL